MSSFALERSSSAVRPHTKRGRHTATPSTQPLDKPASFTVSASSDDDEFDSNRSVRTYSRQTHPASAASYDVPTSLPVASYYSHSTSSPGDSPLYSPSTSPLSFSRNMSGCSTSSYSSSPLQSSQLASSSTSEPYHSPVQHMKRLCVNGSSMDGIESAEEEASQLSSRSQQCRSQPHPSTRRQYQQQQQQPHMLPTSLSFSHTAHTANRVLLKAKRSSAGSFSASVTPYQSPPTSRPSTASSSTIRASFNLSEPSVDHYHSTVHPMPVSSAPTSHDASPQPSATASPQTHYTTLQSSSLPSGPTSFLSLLNLSCASAHSSFSSPAHSPTGYGFVSSSQQATPSSAHSSASFRPRLMSTAERAALFPSRSVTSSPTPPDTHSSSSSSRQRNSTGKRSNGMDSPTPTMAAIEVGRRTSESGRAGKRVKEDKRRDRRRSIELDDERSRRSSVSEEIDGDDIMLQSHLLAPTPRSGASRLSLYIGSSNSLSSLDSPSSTSSYPRMSAPLNSPVSGSQGRRGHIAVDHLLGTAAAAASVARRNSSSSLYEEEEEQGLVEAVGAMQLCSETTAMKAEEDEEKADGTPPKLPAAPRLACRSTSLRLHLAVAASQPSHSPVVESDSEQACAETDDDSVVLSSSPLPSRQQSSSADYYESYIPSTGSFSKVLRSQRQIHLFGSSSSSSSSSPSPFPSSPVLSPLSPSMPLHDDSFMSTAASDASAVVSAPLSPAGLTSGHSSFSSLSSSLTLSGTLNSTFATGLPSSLSPFASLPDCPVGFTRSLSHTVDPRRLPFGGRQHTAGGLDKRHARGGVGASESERGGDGIGLDVPFLKELSLPPRGPAGRRSAMN